MTGWGGGGRARGQGGTGERRGGRGGRIEKWFAKVLSERKASRWQQREGLAEVPQTQ
jgi:hypothetical protein